MDMKRGLPEENDDYPNKKQPQQSTPPRLDTIEGILEDLKTTIAKHGPFNALKPYIESSVLCYFDSDLSDKPEDLGKLLYGIQNVLLEEKRFDKEDIKDLFSQIVQYSYRFATEHDFLEQQSLLEGSPGYAEYIPAELKQEMCQVEHCFD